MQLTLADLSRRASLNELAEAAAPETAAVDGELLALALAGSDESAYDAEAQAAVIDAMVRLHQVLADAVAEVRGYLAGRYPRLTGQSHLLIVHAVDIALYRLFGSEKDSPYERRYRQALLYLREVAAGKIDLEPATATAPGHSDIRVSTAPRVFDKGTLKDFY